MTRGNGKDHAVWLEYTDSTPTAQKDLVHPEPRLGKSLSGKA